MNTTLSDGTIYVQWPSYRHVGVLKESIPILLDDREASLWSSWETTGGASTPRWSAGKLQVW